MVSVVRTTTFFINVFSEPPKVDFERSSRVTAITKPVKPISLPHSPCRPSSCDKLQLTRQTDDNIQNRTGDSPGFGEHPDLPIDDVAS